MWNTGRHGSILPTVQPRFLSISLGHKVKCKGSCASKSSLAPSLQIWAGNQEGDVPEKQGGLPARHGP